MVLEIYLNKLYLMVFELYLNMLTIFRQVFERDMSYNEDWTDVAILTLSVVLLRQSLVRKESFTWKESCES